MKLLINLHFEPNQIRRFIPLILLILFRSPSSFALDYLDMKGVHELLDPQFSHASLVYGSLLLERNPLRNLRFFGNYGKTPSLAFPCSPYFQEKGDCPQDYNSALIKSLFPSPDGRTLVPNQGSSSDILSTLKPSMIGNVVEFISTQLAPPKKLSEEREIERYTTDLSRVIYGALHPELIEASKFTNLTQLVENIEELRKTISQLDTEIQTCNEPGLLAQKEQQRRDLETQRTSTSEKYKGKLRETANQLIDKKLQNSEGKAVRNFAMTLIRAIQEERRGEYPENLALHSLLAYFWGKSKSRGDIVVLAKAMPALLSSKGKQLIDETSSFYKEFIKTPYAKSELVDWAQDPEPIPEKDLHNFEKLAAVYLALENLKDFPTLLSYGRSRHFEGPKLIAEFPDCGETSLRNLFNVIAYDPSTFSFNLNHFNNALIQLNPAFKKFYSDYPTLEAQQKMNLNKRFPQDEWASITANMPKGNYKQISGSSRCEIDGGLPSILEVINGLLFSNSDDFSKKTPLEQLEHLSTVLSRDGFKLGWDLLDTTGKAVDKSMVNLKRHGFQIQFSINEIPRFTWGIDEHHYSLSKAFTNSSYNSYPRIASLASKPEVQTEAQTEVQLETPLTLT